MEHFVLVAARPVWVGMSLGSAVWGGGAFTHFFVGFVGCGREGGWTSGIGDLRHLYALDGCVVCELCDSRAAAPMY